MIRVCMNCLLFLGRIWINLLLGSLNVQSIRFLLMLLVLCLVRILETMCIVFLMVFQMFIGMIITLL